MTCTCQDYDPLCLHNHGGVDGRGDLVCQDCGASTPYAGEDIFDPVANALAAGWMWANHRRNEWACR